MDGVPILLRQIVLEVVMSRLFGPDSIFLLRTLAHHTRVQHGLHAFLLLVVEWAVSYDLQDLSCCLEGQGDIFECLAESDDYGVRHGVCVPAGMTAAPQVFRLAPEIIDGGLVVLFTTSHLRHAF